MPAGATSMIESLEAVLEAHRNSERAVQMARYMRNQFAFYGIRSSELASLARETISSTNKPDEAELRGFVLACWKRPEREWQYVACGFLRRHIRVASPAFLSTLERLIMTKSWWDTVDTLAAHSVGPLVARHGLQAHMDQWVDSPDTWIARTAILHQLRFGAATDAERLFSYCLRRAPDAEFFLRKAIGWALREYSKTDAEAVRRFVALHEGRLSGLSKREALKWLERGDGGPRARHRRSSAR